MTAMVADRLARAMLGVVLVALAPAPARAQDGAFHYQIVVADVARYLDDRDAPIRPGRVAFDWVTLPARPEVGTRLHSELFETYGGFRLGYHLQGTLRERLPSGMINEESLADVTITYTDDARDGVAAERTPTEALIARLPDEPFAVDLRSRRDKGPFVVITPSMKWLIRRGTEAREALHARLDDPRIQNQVAVVLGAIGDATSARLLLERFPDDPVVYYPDVPTDTAAIRRTCFEMALTHLTGHDPSWGVIDVEALGLDPEAPVDRRSLRDRWRAWWDATPPERRVVEDRPTPSWAPRPVYRDAAVAARAREAFVREPWRRRSP